MGLTDAVISRNSEIRNDRGSFLLLPGLQFKTVEKSMPGIGPKTLNVYYILEGNFQKTGVIN